MSSSATVMMIQKEKSTELSVVFFIFHILSCFSQAPVAPMSEDQILEEEKAYFMTRDHDGDGMLNKDEFLRQVL